MRALSHLLPVLLSLACSGQDATAASVGDDASSSSVQEKEKDQKMEPKAETVPASEDPALKTVQAFIEKKSIDKSDPRWKTKLPFPPELEFDPGSNYFWELETNKGPIRVQFLTEVAPMHVSSTIFLTEIGFYDDLKFHRVIKGFMAQGGCPLGTGTGNPGYKYVGEFDKNVRHDRPGLLSMANAGPGTDGSQFFLTFVPTPWLDGKHTIFGEVDADSMKTLRELERFGSESGSTTEPLFIKSARIVVERKPAQKAVEAKSDEKAGEDQG